MIHVEVKENKKEKGVGMVLEKPLNNTYPVGYFSHAWNMDNFKDFDGEITLKNQ